MSMLPSDPPHDLVIAGGGPAGMMAGLLFARAGVKTLVLEKHGDFLRDFRGDTVHPSTLELMNELGFLDEFLARPHDEIRTLTARVANQRITIADLGHGLIEFRLAAAGDEYARAFIGERLGDTEADTGAGTGHDGDLAL